MDVAETYKRYELGRSIASGGMGEVLASRDVELNRTVALKRMLLLPDESGGENAVKYFERFLEEAQITAQLDHPSIVPIHDLGFDDDGRAFYTMRMVQGRELGEVFQIARAETDGWNLSRVVEVLVKVCQAVAYAHGNGVVHRDLKPSNVMVGDLGEVYVMDWGLAKSVEGLRRELVRNQMADQISGLETIAVARNSVSNAVAENTHVGSIVGTPAYMAPEQANGQHQEADPLGDIYALGAVLYELLAAHPPYMANGESTTAEEVIEAVKERAPTKISKRRHGTISVELLAICERAMMRDRERRYQTCLELAEDLQAYLDGRVVRAHESGRLAQARKWVVRNRVLSATLALALAAIVSVAVVSTRASFQLASALERTEQEQGRTQDALAESFFLQGIQHHEQRKVSLALAHWARALDYDRDHHAAAARIASSMLQDVVPIPAKLPLQGASDFNTFVTGPAGRLLAISTVAGDVRLWDLEKETWHQRWSLGAIPRFMTFHPEGELLVVLTTRKAWDTVSVHWLDVKTGKTRWPTTFIDEKMAFSNDAVFSADGQWMAAQGRVWSMQTGEMVFVPRPKEIADFRRGFGPRTALSADGRWLLLGAMTGHVFIYDMFSRDLLVKHRPARQSIDRVIWSADAKFYACLIGSTDVRVFHRATNAPAGPVISHQGTVETLEFAPGGDSILTGGTDGLARMWDTTAGELRYPPMQHEASLHSAAFNPDGTQVTTVSTDQAARIWSAKSVQTSLRALSTDHKCCVARESFDHDESRRIRHHLARAEWTGIALPMVLSGRCSERSPCRCHVS